MHRMGESEAIFVRVSDRARDCVSKLSAEWLPNRRAYTIDYKAFQGIAGYRGGRREPQRHFYVPRPYHTPSCIQYTQRHRYSLVEKFARPENLSQIRAKEEERVVLFFSPFFPFHSRACACACAWVYVQGLCIVRCCRDRLATGWLDGCSSWRYGYGNLQGGNVSSWLDLDEGECA